MKVAIYIEDGTQQLVLTPEGQYERGIIEAWGKDIDRIQVFEGSFYECRGGWVRQGTSEKSLIMRIGRTTEAVE